MGWLGGIGGKQGTMHELQPHLSEKLLGLAAPPAESAGTVMTRLEHWRHVLAQLQRDAAETKYGEIKLLIGMTILAVEDAITAAGGLLG